MDKSHYSDRSSSDTIPTLPDDEDAAPTDFVNDTVEEIMDNIKAAFSLEDRD